MKSSLLVKIFLVLNLLFVIGVTAFGVVVFMDREVVKARIVLLQEHTLEVADALGYAEQQPWEQETAGATAFALNKPSTMDEVSTYVDTLNSLEAVAGTRTTQLSETYDEVTSTQQTLAEEQATLREREADLSRTRTEVATLEQNVSSTQGNLTDTRTELTTLQRSNTTLRNQVADLEQQSGRIEEQISGVREELELRTGERDRVEDLLAACRQPRNEDGGDDNWHQKTGTVLAVEPEWNFVVINKGEVDVLPMFLEAFVHRGDEFVGKIRVMQVEDSVAVAEIVKESMTPGLQVKAGDTIFF